MKKIYLFLSLGFACFLQPAFSQQLLYKNQNGPQVKRCYTAEAEQQFRATHPNAPSISSFENWIANKIEERKRMPKTEGVNPPVTVAVVFHIIHNGTPVGSGINISQHYIQQQVLQLNKDFANLSNSPYAVSEDMGIRFALAGEDPTGHPLAEPGIDRVDRHTEGFTAPPYNVGAGGQPDYLNNTIKPATIWDPTKYVNIWVSDYQSGILGIATFPLQSGLSGLGGSESNNTAGVAIAYTSVGSVFSPQGCEPYGKGRTLTHELGHFFGLRHIWGDGNCATDYCNDTPTHKAANNGEPVHPKPNSCGTADEMFENYMDYCDDIITNTFTSNQADRMEAVMANSPRRNTLGSANVPKIMVTASNQISFHNCVNILSFSEKGKIGVANRYKDVQLYLNVEDKATGAATVTFTNSGTAVQGRDYQVLNNPVMFASGDNYKPVTIRIFDNAEVDGDVNIELGYTISGSGVTPGSNTQTFNIYIADDDDVIMNQGTFNFLNESFDAGVLPAGWSSLISTGNPNIFKVGANGNANGTAPAAYLSSDNVNHTNTYNSNVAGASALRTVEINPNRVKSLNNLTFKYRVWGSSSDYGLLLYNLAGRDDLYYWGNSTGLNGRGPYYGTGSPVSRTPNVAVPAFLQENNFSINFYFTTTGNGSGFSPGLNIDDVKIIASGYEVETAVSNSYPFTVKTGNSNANNFRSISNNNMIATVKNISENVNDLTAAVATSGNNKIAITTPVGSSFRTEKAISLNPGVANSTASYEVTLYFTPAELATWGIETSTLKIMKIKSGSLAGNNYTPANAEIVPTTYSNQSAKGYYAFTGTVTGGFSDFVLVSTSTLLPVNLLSFEAVAKQKAIELNFSTAQELNNKGFIIERSTDALHYTNISWVDGKGNSSLKTNYSFTDHFVSPRVVYYYRLRQVDVDNQEKLSLVRQAKIDGAEILVSLTPNPTKNKVKLFVSGISNKVNIKMFNSQGKLVRKWNQINLTGLPIMLNVSGLGKGMYHFSIVNGTEVLNKQLILQ